MAKRLNKLDIRAIVNLINAWDKEKLTWEEICVAAEPLVGARYCRQALSDHEEIVLAYRTRKKTLREATPTTPKPGSLNVASSRISNLESELERIKLQNKLYKQQFVVWQYNAYKKGLKESDLNKPLPMIDRERSDQAKR